MALEPLVTNGRFGARASAQRFSLRPLKRLLLMSKPDFCTEVILDCEEHNVKFYEKCGFALKEVEMAW